VHRQLVGNLLVELGVKPAERYRAVPAVPGPNDLPGRDVQGGEQAGDPGTEVVVGAALGHARQHRQHRLGPVQRLDLGLLVHTQHQRPLGRIQGQPDHVADLVDALRVARQLEPSGRWGVRRTAFPIRPTVDFDSPDRLAIDARDQGWRRSGLLEGGDHHRLDLFRR
jgi:hypothetical protein